MKSTILNVAIAVCLGGLMQSCTCKTGETGQTGKKLFEHVIVIGVDGMTSDGLMKAKTPVMDDLIAHGAFKYDARTILPTVSAPNWGAMLHGAGPEATGIISNNRDNWMTPVDKSRMGMFPNIFNIIREQMPDAEQGSIFHWGGFGQLLQEEVVNRYNTYNSPEETTKQICDYITSKKPVLLFTQLDHVDGAGHGFGYQNTPEYLASIEKTDSLTGLIMESIRQAGMENNTLVMIVSDHGGINTGHGGVTLEELTVPVIYYGKGIKQNYKIQQTVYMFDVAANIAFALNLKMPHVWTGRPTLPAYEGYSEPVNN
jgi:predicted AlkP superfamily pyrophosphatase or phosphodiesterase